MTGVSARLAALRARRAAPVQEPEYQTSAGLPGTWFAITDDDRLHLYLRADGNAHPQSLEHVSVSRRVIPVLGTPTDLVDVVCITSSVCDVWEHFLSAYLKRAESGMGLVLALGEELEAWRAFLTPSHPPPSAAACAELLGELLVLRDLCQLSPAALAAWVGTRHDFHSAGNAIEVKTTRTTASQVVTIHGEEQLVVPDGGSLHLHFVRLEHTPGRGVSVKSVVDEVLDAGVDPLTLYKALENHKMSPAEVSESASTTFTVLTRRTFPVDEDFPRIVPASFAGGRLPTGVEGVTYRVDLATGADSAVAEEDYLGVCRQLADATVIGA